MFGSRAIDRLLQAYEFVSVLDIGSGSGQHADIFKRAGKEVTEIDLGGPQRPGRIVGDFNTLPFSGKFDCVWASHVLEHQPDVQGFLGRVRSVLREGGPLAITVPPLKHEIVGGHVSLWNTGLLLYRLVLAGFDCSRAEALCYGYNISVIVRKRTITLPALCCDRGDLSLLRPYFPSDIEWRSGGGDIVFDGDIGRIGW